MSTIPCLEIKQALDRNESYTRRLSFRNKNTNVCSAATDWTWFKAAEKISIEQLLPDISEVTIYFFFKNFFSLKKINYQ